MLLTWPHWPASMRHCMCCPLVVPYSLACLHRHSECIALTRMRCIVLVPHTAGTPKGNVQRRMAQPMSSECIGLVRRDNKLRHIAPQMQALQERPKVLHFEMRDV